MKRVFLFVCLSLSLVFSARVFAQDAPKSFRRHYIIVVDQGACQGHKNMPELYLDLKYLFENNSIRQSSDLSAESFAEDFSFDPLSDEVSIFASGITESDFSRIVNNSQGGGKSADEINDMIVSALFRRQKSFQEARSESETDVATYFDNNLKPFMSGHSGGIRVGLNEFLYPLILGKLNLSVPAEAYYILRVSNFTSQGAAKSVKETQLKPLVVSRQQYVDGFDNYCRSIESPFFRQPSMKIVHQAALGGSNYANLNNNPVVMGDKLGLASLVSVGLSNMSSPHFEQKSYGKDVFSYSGASIVFPHDDHITVDKVFWDVEGQQMDMTSKYTYKKESSQYVFPHGEMKLGKAQEGDIVKMNYVFYAQSKDDEGKDLLPMVFKSGSQYQLEAGDFVPAPNNKLIWLVLIVVLGLLAFLAYWIWKRRGLNRKVWVESVIRPVSRSRFMEVKDKKVVNEDCWYMGPDNQTQRITLEGELKKEELPFSKDYHYRLEYYVIDEDSEDDFTFRPDGFDDQGKNLRKEQWYKVDVKPNGRFKLNILTYLDTENSPDLADPDKLRQFFADSDHPYRLLKLHVKFRVLVLDPKEKRVNIDAIQLPDSVNPERYCVKEKQFPMPGKKDARFERIYDFIVKPDIERKSAWIAFDPGTTGSCAAFAFDGNPWDSVVLAKNQYSVTDGTKKETTCIFPSVVKVQDRARCFAQSGDAVADVERWALNEDFIFGNRASQRLGNNRFRSIKKLLGYTNLLELKKDNSSKYISGKDLAFLLVKGLYKEVGDYAMENAEVDDNLRRKMSDESGHFAPMRAIVAVPNNYTLLKIQDMVDSVKRLGCFEEVHYLYESEGVMMNYLNRMWTHLSKDDNDKVFIVYDMGGATINATAFRLNIIFNNHDNIDRLTVRTVSKVGYCVGGDDIDYALIRFIFDMPAVSSILGDDEEVKVDIMNKNKQKLIRFATNLKLDLIDEHRNDLDKLRYLSNIEQLINAVCSILKECGITVHPTMFGEADQNYIATQLYKQNHAASLMYKYVYSKVEDAVNELMKDLVASKVELIFSGRSSLYPHIQEYVTKTMVSRGFTPNKWDGFNDERGNLDADAVKTAVASGACWYAVFNTIIRLDHSVIPSTFGFIDQVGGKPKFVPVIKRLDNYVDGKKSHSVEPVDTSLQKVTFLQMLGSDYDKILDDFYHKRNMHKINVLEEIPGEILDGSLETVSITVEDNNNFDYDVETSTKHITPRSNRYSRLFGHEGTAVKTEIVEENNASYVFAALQSVDEIVDVDSRPVRPSGGGSRSSANRSGRRDDLLEGMGYGSDSNAGDGQDTHKESKKTPRL